MTTNLQTSASRMLDSPLTTNKNKPPPMDCFQKTQYLALKCWRLARTVYFFLKSQASCI